MSVEASQSAPSQTHWKHGKESKTAFVGKSPISIFPTVHIILALDGENSLPVARFSKLQRSFWAQKVVLEFLYIVLVADFSGN